jgi:uncharacterized protein (UPF0333 family)
MRDAERGSRKLVIVLLAIIAVLALVVVYAFVVKPGINGYAVKAYNGGAQDAVLTIAQQAAQCPPTGVPITIGNQTITLVAVECYQQAASSG